MIRHICLLAVLTGANSVASATETTSVPEAGILMQVLFGLFIVLFLMIGGAWLARRAGVANPAGSAPVKVVGGVGVGGRERVVVVQIADQWIVIGVAPGRVNALATLPSQNLPAIPASAGTGNFSGWIKHAMERRDAQR